MADPVKLNLAAINQIMTSPAAQRLVDQEGKRLARAAGADFRYRASPHRWTARGYVEPANARGRRQEAREKRLARAIGSTP
ncbi:hypothetical protein J2X55_002257 [Microbacterium sp. 1154]|uniref:hypothetical protein n=1 Tax=Microbacterium sp. 1154 TaxID=2817733 RepID=UPI00285A6579|nr:hypothetical protein [Microbacterium sp. 1154]MDR6691345.1 hypothetical protein [Microbacterium sp. 1154]